MPDSWPRPARPRLAAWLLYRVQRLLAPNRFYRWAATRLEAFAPAYRLFTAHREGGQGRDLRLPDVRPVHAADHRLRLPGDLPQAVAQRPLRRGRRGWFLRGVPGTRCVWLVAYERAEHAGQVADLQLLQRPVDHRRRGQSSWVNYWQGRDGGL